MIFECILFILVLLLVYGWMLYPVGISMGRKKLQVTSGGGETTKYTRRKGGVSVLLAAYNEEKCIESRLMNLVDTVPVDTQIYVGIDGATDGTAEIANRFAEKYDSIHVHESKERRGKIAVLKDLVGGVQDERGCLPTNYTNGEEMGSVSRKGAKAQNGEPTSLKLRRPSESGVLVFTDANTIFRKGALEKLLRHFDDKEVGGVCGRLVLRRSGEKLQGYKLQACPPAGGLQGGEGEGGAENSYWRWEAKLKEKESCIDSCLGANGAIYAIRRELFWSDIPDNTIVDDFVIGMKVREAGRTMVYEPEAVAEEDMPEQENEWGRRVRIGAGDYQALTLCSACLLPKFGKFAWMFWSHKVLRWFTPHIMLLVLLVSSVLVLSGAENFFARAVMVALGTLCGCGLVGAMTRRNRSMLFRFCQLCDHFLAMQAALFVGFMQFCRGGLRGTWERTERAAE